MSPARVIYLGELEQDASKVANGISSALGGIRTVAEAHIRGSLYYYCTPSVFQYIYMFK